VNDLFAAIVAKFATTPMLASYSIYPYHAPQDAILPYCTYMEVLNEPIETFTDTSENPLIQISVWDSSPSPLAVVAIAKSIKAAFDWQRLFIADHIHISTARQAERLVEDPDGGWHYSIDYRIEYT